MRGLSLVLVLMVVGCASCTCIQGAKNSFRSVEGCAINRMYKPICGSDGCNYINDNALKCAQDYDRTRNIPEQEVVREAYEGPCRETTESGNEVAVDDGLLQLNNIKGGIRL